MELWLDHGKFGASASVIRPDDNLRKKAWTFNDVITTPNHVIPHRKK